MSSIMASAWGQNKLNRWRELGLQAFFFSNNSHANHPILYKYGGPTKNAGIERKNPRGEIDPDGSIVFISAVNHDQKQVHELLNLDGYATQAYGRKLIFDETIKVGGDGDLSSYQHFCDISIFGTETSLLMNEQGYYLAEQPIKEPNENDMIILGSLDVRDYVHTNLLESLFQYHKMRKLKFGN